MKKGLFAAAALLFLMGGIFAADRLAVAEPVGQGGVPASDVEAFWGMLESSVDGGYELVSRSALKQMMTEIGLVENSGLANLNSAQKAKLGELKTVRYILVSNIGKFGRRLNVSLMVVDASTGDVLPDRKTTETVDSLDELADKLPDMLLEIGLGRVGRARGIYAMLEPAVTAKKTPDYLRESFTTGLENALLEKGIRLRNLRYVAPILKKNNIGSLDAVEPAMYARVGRLLRVDSLIQPAVTRFSVTVKKEYIAASKRNVVRCIGNFDGNVRIVSATTGELVASIPFRQKIDFDEVDATVDTDDWTDEDYGRYAIEKQLPLIAGKVLKALGR